MGLKIDTDNRVVGRPHLAGVLPARRSGCDREFAKDPRHRELAGGGEKAGQQQEGERCGCDAKRAERGGVTSEADNKKTAPGGARWRERRGVGQRGSAPALRRPVLHQPRIDPLRQPCGSVSRLQTFDDGSELRLSFHEDICSLHTFFGCSGL